MSKKNPKFIPKLKTETEIEEYLSRLNVQSTISNKMHKLCEMSVLSQQENEERQDILSYLYNLLQPYFPDCSLLVFGSSLNGFGTKGCDMDLMFLPFPGYRQLDVSEIDDSEYLPTLNDVRVNPYLLTQLKNMSKEKLLRFILRVFRRNKNNFRTAVFIPARCPIIRFYSTYKNYGLSCDVSFYHGLAIYNTALLRFYSTIDSRVRPLMITLRFWAKNLKIIHTGAFSSYAFSLMVIFFLQNLKDPILPSVNELMTDAELQVVDGWEVGVSSKVRRYFERINRQPVGDLLNAFFKFYWKFDFTKNAVCVRTGKALPLYNIKNGRDERMKNFMVGDVCVQDPFDLSHNVGSSVHLHRIEFLKPYFFVASRMLWQKSDSEDKFKLLFKKKEYEDMIQEHFLFCESNTNVCFCIYPNFEIVSALGEKFSEKFWFERAPQVVRDILQHIFLFDCEVIDKNRTLTDSHYSKLLLSVQCLVDTKVWKYRNTKKDMPLDAYAQNFSNEVLKEENAFSLYLVDSYPGLQTPEPVFTFRCDCYKFKYPQMPCIWISLTPIVSSTDFKSVSRLLKNFIPPTVKKILNCEC